MTLRWTTFAAVALLGGGGSLVFMQGCGGGGDDPEKCTGDPCFDYSKFESDSPKVSFRADVLPLFRRSCGLSDSCHQSQTHVADGQPFLGTKLGTTLSEAQIRFILGEIVDRTAHVPVGADKFVDEPDGHKIVAPGKPEESFMMFKLDALECNQFCEDLKCAKGDDCGSHMPQGSPQLPADERDTIRKWIAQGAEDN